jgi:chromosome segregation ATPase
MEHQHHLELLDIDGSYKEKLDTEIARYDALIQHQEQQSDEYSRDLEILKQEHAAINKQLALQYESKITAENSVAGELHSQRIALRAAITAKTDALESDADSELDKLKLRYESRLANEKKTVLLLMADNSMLKDKYERLETKKKSLKNRLLEMANRERELFDHIASLQKDVSGHKKEIREREETLNEKDNRIYDLRRKNQELEKFKFVLNYKIQ